MAELPPDGDPQADPPARRDAPSGAAEPPPPQVPVTAVANPPTSSNWRAYVRGGIWAVLAFISGVFVVSNRDQVTVNYVFAQSEQPLFVSLFVAVLLGAVIGGLAVWGRMLRKTRQATKAAKEAKRQTGA